MGPKLWSLLLWGIVWLSGCSGGGNQGLVSAGRSGAWSPASAGGAGDRNGRVAGSALAGDLGSAAAGGMRAGSPAAISGSGAGAGGSSVAAAGSGSQSTPLATERFSFFITSVEAMRRLSKSEAGFGGDLRYGEANGLAGADKICTEVAESSLPGAGAKVWHAFLSAKAAGPNGSAVHAKDRIGNGPWYDRVGRLVAMDLSSLLQTRPSGADPAIVDNLPNERGEPNRSTQSVDNHDTITGSTETGEFSGGPNCEDYTTTTTPPPPPAAGSGGSGGGSNHLGPMCGHSWPAQSGQSWIKAHHAPGCAPSVSIVQMGRGFGEGIGNSGGYGGIYCFALSP